MSSTTSQASSTHCINRINTNVKSNSHPLAVARARDRVANRRPPHPTARRGEGKRDETVSESRHTKSQRPVLKLLVSVARNCSGHDVASHIGVNPERFEGDQARKTVVAWLLGLSVEAPFRLGRKWRQGFSYI